MRVRRTRVDAARARSATVRRRAIRRQRNRQQQFAQEKPRALLLIDQARIPANPAQSSRPRIGSFEQRRRIHADRYSNGSPCTFGMRRTAVSDPRAGHRGNPRPRHSARSSRVIVPSPRMRMRRVVELPDTEMLCACGKQIARIGSQDRRGGPSDNPSRRPCRRARHASKRAKSSDGKAAAMPASSKPHAAREFLDLLLP